MAMPADHADRQTTTPFLLKLYYRQGAFPSINDFTSEAASPPHVEIHTWPTCTLRELSHHLVVRRPAPMPSPSIGVRLCFRLIYADTRGAGAGGPSAAPRRFLSADLGSVVIGDAGEDEKGPAAAAALPKSSVGNQGPLATQPDLMLKDGRFVVGDYIAVAILPPLENGDVAPPLKDEEPARRLAGRGRGREWVDGRGFSSERGHGFRGRGRGVFGQQPDEGFGRSGLPNGEWRRGETVPVGRSAGTRRGGYMGGRGRDRW